MDASFIRNKLQNFTVAILASLLITLVPTCEAVSPNMLFPDGLSQTQFLEFSCEGYSAPVSGIIYRPNEPVCCGMSLGGIGTGCLDLQVEGVLGFETLFNAYPRWPQSKIPYLGITTGGKTYVLATEPYIKGGQQNSCWAPVYLGPDFALTTGNAVPTEGTIEIKQVESVKNISYFGHYPIADMQYDMDAPVQVAQRAWSPFIPGDAAASNIPAIVFEVHLRNTTAEQQSGTVALSFPGIHEGPSKIRKEVREKMKPAMRPSALLGDFVPQFKRTVVSEPAQGVAIEGEDHVEYFLGVIGSQRVRTGAELSSDSMDWSQIATKLPPAKPYHSGSSVAVDFTLEPNANQSIRFLLAWYSPQWQGEMEYRYTNFYALRYSSAMEVAGRMVLEHEALLRRIMAWQQVIYAETSLPIWLRDTLINNLCLITEDSYWAAPKFPLPDWTYPNGLFVMNECPRGCPQIECIPCTWYGNIPVIYFYPELARTTLRGFAHYMREDGAIPFNFAPISVMGLMSPSHEAQKSVNGFCFADMIHRLWKRTNDPSVIQEFYPALKKSTIFTMNMNTSPDGVISFPTVGDKTEWWEGFDWHGMAVHVGGLRLSQLTIAGQWAKLSGDREFAEQCQKWLEQGKNSMETKMWNEQAKSYYMYNDPHDTGKFEDKIMANQLDGEWVNDAHGLPGVFREDRVKTVLETVKNSTVCHYGSVSFAKPDGTPLITYGIFVPEIMMLGYTFMYNGDPQTGLKVLQGCMETNVLKNRNPWDMPNMMQGSCVLNAGTDKGVHVDAEGFGEGNRGYGADYYQNLMLWAAPAAVLNQPLQGPCQPGGLVDRIIKAGAK